MEFQNKYVVLLDNDGEWGVGEIIVSKTVANYQWVNMKRSNLSKQDAEDLCDIWNARGTEMRPQR